MRIIDNTTVNIIDECEGFQNPVLILKKAQEHILVGRQLDIVDPSTELKGEINFIIIDRDHLFQDALAEVALTDNYFFREILYMVSKKYQLGVALMNSKMYS